MAPPTTLPPLPSPNAIARPPSFGAMETMIFLFSGLVSMNFALISRPP